LTPLFLILIINQPLDWIQWIWSSRYFSAPIPFSLDPWRCLARTQYYGLDTVWVCPPVLQMLNTNPHCEVPRGWELNPIMIFRGGAFGSSLGLIKLSASTVEHWWL
jgi:hypothetical protein